jgi:hypothetical protein
MVSGWGDASAHCCGEWAYRGAPVFVEGGEHANIFFETIKKPNHHAYLAYV